MPSVVDVNLVVDFPDFLMTVFFIVLTELRYMRTIEAKVGRDQLR